jgi:hypothetical protein
LSDLKLAHTELSRARDHLRNAHGCLENVAYILNRLAEGATAKAGRRKCLQCLVRDRREGGMLCEECALMAFPAHPETSPDSGEPAP